MCVIISRNAGVKIPADMIEQACDINKHGWGLMYAKKGKLHIDRSLKQPNDPKEVMDKLQSLGDRHVYLHLRHATVGEINAENSHPFTILTRKRHGVDLAMMHNGTLFTYKPEVTNTKDSDTLMFVRQMVAPLAQRVNAFCGQKVLFDKFFTQIIHGELHYTQSVILFLDSNGTELIFHKEKGKQFDGWWASTADAFDSQHLRSSSRTPTSYGNNVHGDIYHTPYWEQNTTDPVPWSHKSTDKAADRTDDALATWEADLKAHDKAAEAGKPITTTLIQVKEVARTKYECKSIAQKVVNTDYKHGASVMTTYGTLSATALHELKTPFTELAGLKDLMQVGKMTEIDLIEMSSTYPKGMSRLVIDLLTEVANLKVKNETQAETIITLTKDKKAA